MITLVVEFVSTPPDPGEGALITMTMIFDDD